MGVVAESADRSEGRAVFLHDALFYDGPDDFVARTGAFIRDSVAAREPILVAVAADKARLIHDELDGETDGVRFADIVQVGTNPARIIPVWRDFVAEHGGSGRRFRGIGEPIWPSRSVDELVEAERHEALLNLAFNDAPPWWLACPYDVSNLPQAVLDEAKRNHPFVVEGGDRRPSTAYRGLDDVSQPFAHPLAEPAGPAEELAFGDGSSALAAVRATVAHAASAFGLDEPRADDLVLVANEIATNSLRHGGGSGVLRLWRDDGSLICEIRDAGRIADPLVGRGQPTSDQVSGFGLWLAHQLCDLVQIRTFATGSVVRLHVRR